MWHRAYAEALIGLHRDALADLAKAEERAKAKGGVQRPDWADMIDASARCDVRRLDAAAHGGPQAAVGALLLLTVQEYPALYNVTLPAARDVLALDPECYRAFDAICRVHGINNRHEATTIGPQVLDQMLPRRLRALATLPEGVRSSTSPSAGLRHWPRRWSRPATRRRTTVSRPGP